jgi:hypothetical protein
LSEDGSFDELIDQRLENKFDRLEMERMAACAAAAVRHSAKRRPKMKQVIETAQLTVIKLIIDHLVAWQYMIFFLLCVYCRLSVRWRATRRWTT